MLATPEALKIAKAKGIDDPQKSEKCAKCHTTAYGADAKLLTATFKGEDGVGCEACHGPGSNYKTLKIMKDRALAVQNGLIVPDEKTCVKCHNAESPTYKKFVFAEFYKKIAHPVPGYVGVGEGLAVVDRAIEQRLRLVEQRSERCQTDHRGRSFQRVNQAERFVRRLRVGAVAFHLGERGHDGRNADPHLVGERADRGDVDGSHDRTSLAGRPARRNARTPLNATGSSPAGHSAGASPGPRSRKPPGVSRDANVAIARGTAAAAK